MLELIMPEAPVCRSGTQAFRLAVVCDYPEEQWPSMDLCADMLLDQVQSSPWGVAALRICPPFRRRLATLPIIGRRSWAHNSDRFLNRHRDFPRYLRRRRGDFDFFHICDHSYSQLALELPGERTGVFCHDVDAFRCLIEPAREPRPRWFRWMMARVLLGMRKAAVVFHATAAVKEQILRHDLVPAEKLVHAPLGCAPEFNPTARQDDSVDRILADNRGRPFLLHVGSCIPRKRVDFLLQVFAGVRARFPDLRLIKVGGSWSRQQENLIRRLGLAAGLIHVRDVARPTLAGLYRRAALVLLPSEAEGFGLPMLEALACGAPVLATDLPVLREVGGEAVTFAPVGDPVIWEEQAAALLTKPELAPSRQTRLAQARRYSWQEHARIIFETYRRLAE